MFLEGGQSWPWSYGRWVSYYLYAISAHHH